MIRVKRSPSPLALRLSLLMLVGTGLGCLSPFERLNPHDEEMALVLEIVGGKDSTRTLGDVLVFQLNSDPVLTGYEPTWQSSQPGFLQSYGGGAFVVTQLPTSGSTTVDVRASFIGHTISRTVTLRPPQ